MKHTIVAEHFSLTPAIQSHVMQALDKLEALIPESAFVRVFLSEPAPKLFTAAFAVHLHGKDLIGTQTGPNLYTAISKAKNHLVRRISGLTQKRVSRRRKLAREVPIVGAS